ncbi:MAG: hypothetical protein ACRCYZ_04105 [Alphaproteobacteria bacterium]
MNFRNNFIFQFTLFLILHTLANARVFVPEVTVEELRSKPTASAVQASVANELGILRKEGLDSFTHKIGHAFAGAAAGAILDLKNPGKGAAAGALGAVVGEVVAEALPETLTRETRADYGKIAAATGALLSKQDVPTAIATADTALQNNFLLAIPAAVAVGAVVADKIVGAAMTAYDAYQGYLEEGAAGAAKSLATDGAIGLVAGGTAKILLKGGKHLAKKGLKSAQSAMKPQTVIGKREGKVSREKFERTIQFGRVENQIKHTFRHVEAAGLNKDIIRNAIQKNLLKIADKLPSGHYNGSVAIKNKTIQYSAFKFDSGVVNVGRITLGKLKK